ncbi:MAG TPA: carboxypeptidase-like regulatory domain-containing protein [Methylomirabilota bacterium]|nr:carboxypeptidase-like regulatory domain-containing protein [Methylomirabilota bacterium]
MKFVVEPASLAVVALGLVMTISTPVWPGGSSDEPDVHQDEGPSYFGFVKDTSGKIIPDAKVTAEIKGRGAVVTRSDKLGTYKLPGFGKEVPPANVTISCTKDGYKQTRTLRRTTASKNPVAAIETECTMQRIGAK